MDKCKYPKESIVERRIRRRDGKEVLVRACAKCGRILEVICLKCGTRKWRNDSYTRKDGTHVERFAYPNCGKSISLAPFEIITNKKCIGVHEDLEEVTEIKKNKTRIKVLDTLTSIRNSVRYFYELYDLLENIDVDRVRRSGRIEYGILSEIISVFARLIFAMNNIVKIETLGFSGDIVDISTIEGMLNILENIANDFLKMKIEIGKKAVAIDTLVKKVKEKVQNKAKRFSEYLSTMQTIFLGDRIGFITPTGRFMGLIASDPLFALATMFATTPESIANRWSIVQRTISSMGRWEKNMVAGYYLYELKRVAADVYIKLREYMKRVESDGKSRREAAIWLLQSLTDLECRFLYEVLYGREGIMSNEPTATIREELVNRIVETAPSKLIRTYVDRIGLYGDRVRWISLEEDKEDFLRGDVESVRRRFASALEEKALRILYGESFKSYGILSIFRLLQNSKRKGKMEDRRIFPIVIRGIDGLPTLESEGIKHEDHEWTPTIDSSGNNW